MKAWMKLTLVCDLWVNRILCFHFQTIKEKKIIFFIIVSLFSLSDDWWIINFIKIFHASLEMYFLKLFQFVSPSASSNDFCHSSTLFADRQATSNYLSFLPFVRLASLTREKKTNSNSGTEWWNEKSRHLITVALYQQEEETETKFLPHLIGESVIGEKICKTFLSKASKDESLYLLLQ